jgi:hypothetical protein
VGFDEVAEARKVGFDKEEAWLILKQAKTVHAAKGKKFNSWEPNEENKEAILKAAVGPSGKLRAPTLRVGDQIFVGFHPELYDRHF